MNALEKLIALAGSERVDGYTRRTKSGKTVHVSSYTRDPGKMSNNALYSELKKLNSGDSGLPPTALPTRKKSLTDEISKRVKDGSWGQSNKREGERARKKVAALPDESSTPSPTAPKPKAPAKPQYKGIGHSSSTEFEKNKVTPKAPFARGKNEDGKDVPVADPAYDEHVKKLEAILYDKENDKFQTHKMFGIFDDSGKFVAYEPAREEQHRQIISEMLGQAAQRGVPKERKAVMSGGLGGSGKGTVLKKYADIDEEKFIVIDPDAMKGELLKRGMVPEVKGLLPLEHANFIHEESSDLANMLHMVAVSQGYNVILDTTMAGKSSAKGGARASSAFGKAKIFSDAGYTIEGIFVDVPVEVSIASAMGRHRGGVERFNTAEDEMGGRYVPPAYIEDNRAEEGSQYWSKNREVFEAMREDGIFTARVRRFDNSVRTADSKPVLVLDVNDNPEAPKKGSATKKAMGKVEEVKKKAAKDAAMVPMSGAVERLISLTRVK